jgi:hypothetical protein
MGPLSFRYIEFAGAFGQDPVGAIDNPVYGNELRFIGFTALIQARADLPPELVSIPLNSCITCDL